MLQCARQIKDAHREARELVAAESARESASSQGDQPAVARAGVSDREEPQQHHRTQHGSSPVAEHSAVNGSASKPLAPPTVKDVPVSARAAGSIAAENAEDLPVQETGAAVGAAGVSAADSVGFAGGQAQEERGSRGGFEEYETDELSPLERDVAVAAEGVTFCHIVKLSILQRLCEHS